MMTISMALGPPAATGTGQFTDALAETAAGQHLGGSTADWS